MDPFQFTSETRVSGRVRLTSGTEAVPFRLGRGPDALSEDAPLSGQGHGHAHCQVTSFMGETESEDEPSRDELKEAMGDSS